MSLIITLDHHGSFPLFEFILNTLIGDNPKEKTLIDLCAYAARVTKDLPMKSRTFVDVTDEGQIPPEAGRFVHASALGDDPVFNEHFDVATCLDGIEHMPKPEGYQLLKRMEAISDKQILFTPLGEWMVEPHSTDPKAHKCGWLPEDAPDYAAIVFPNYHQQLNCGAWFFWKCADIENDIQRVARALNTEEFQRIPKI